jgi:hypothetical protein
MPWEDVGVFGSDRRRTNNNLPVATADLTADCGRRRAVGDEPTEYESISLLNKHYTRQIPIDKMVDSTDQVEETTSHSQSRITQLHNFAVLLLNPFLQNIVFTGCTSFRYLVCACKNYWLARTQMLSAMQKRAASAASYVVRLNLGDICNKRRGLRVRPCLYAFNGAWCHPIFPEALGRRAAQSRLLC